MLGLRDERTISSNISVVFIFYISVPRQPVNAGGGGDRVPQVGNSHPDYFVYCSGVCFNFVGPMFLMSALSWFIALY
jgi:hypothetical protein